VQDTEPAVDLAAKKRSLFGMSTALWSSHGEHLVEPGWWKAMSGARSVNLNVVLCHGADSELVARNLGFVNGRIPTLIGLAGPALGHAKVLCDTGLVCIGTSAFMALEDIDDLAFEFDPQAIEAGPADLSEVRDVLCETFRYTPEMARTAIPEDVCTTPGQRVWLLWVDGRICSTVATVVVDSVLAVWSMATRPDLQRQGYGRRLLSTALAQAASEGVTESLLLATPAGEALFRALGYRVMEHWQQWSRPRWVWAFAPS
jgi:GNAT superfamily N-acetyltransferase